MLEHLTTIVEDILVIKSELVSNKDLELKEKLKINLEYLFTEINNIEEQLRTIKSLAK